MGIGANSNRQNMVPIYGANGLPTGMFTMNRFMGGNMPAPPPPQPSMTDIMLERARQASQNVNVPSIADLFPLMMQNYQAPQMGQMMPQGQAPMQSSGAGRFLGETDSAPALNFGVNTVT